jgi:MFS family permease
MLKHDASPLRHAGFCALFAAQLLGALNDNFFKMVVALIAMKEAADGRGGRYLTATAIALILPYLLFSGYAGSTADRIGKRSILVASKVMEIVIMALAVGTLMMRSVELLLSVLFLLAIQAAFFSPAKYGILSEMLPVSMLQRANGLLEMSRYCAVIAGTVLGGLALETWSDDPVVIGNIMIAIAVAGLLACLFIPKAPTTCVGKPLRMNPWGEIGAGMRRISRDRSLLSAVAGITVFEGLGAMALPTIVLVGEDTLGLDEIHISLLPAFVGIGLALGCWLAGRWSLGRIETGMVSIGLLGIGVALLAVPVAMSSYASFSLVLLLAGLSGGLIYVPLNAALQNRAERGERGQIIATNNFLNMTAVLLLSGAPWLFCDLVGIAPEDVLMGSGLVTLAATIALLALAPDVAIRSAAWTRTMLRSIRSPGANLIACAAIALAGMVWTSEAGAVQLEPVRTHKYSISHPLFGDIGTLQQEIRSEGDGTIVESRLTIVVQAFSFIVLREIEARCREAWLRQQLVSYSCVTRDDGELTEISGHAENGRFVVTGPTGKNDGPADIRPLSPWSIAFTRCRFVIAAGSGKTEQVSIQRGPDQRIEVAGQTVQVRHFIANGDEEFELWYDSRDVPVKFTLTAEGTTITFLILARNLP